MRMDVTPIVNKWLDGTFPNEGFIIKRSGSYTNGDSNTDGMSVVISSNL